MSRYNFSSDSYIPDDRDEREREAESRSDAEREENQTKSIYDFSTVGEWDSHRPMLIWALQKITTGTVIEFGAGEGSTAMLERLCYEQRRKFVSYETNREYLFSSSKTVFIESYDNVIRETCGILFIDNAPGERRKGDAERFADIARAIIIHDSQQSADYVYKLSELKFKYSCSLKNSLGLPETKAYSNSYDFRQWRGVRAGEFWFE